MIKYTTHTTPIGSLVLAETDQGLCRILFPDEQPAEVLLAQDFQTETIKQDPRTGEAARSQLDEYFSGRRTTFDLSLDLQTTPFFKRVLQAVSEIPYGEISTYGDIAKKIGNPRAVRAVGAANARNPMPIIIPCHRVLGKGGQLTGYGGGLDRKQYLLTLEQKHR